MVTRATRSICLRTDSEVPSTTWLSQTKVGSMEFWLDLFTQDMEDDVEALPAH